MENVGEQTHLIKKDWSMILITGVHIVMIMITIVVVIILIMLTILHQKINLKN